MAFTLIELLVVVALIGLFASLGIAAFNYVRTQAGYAANKERDAAMYHNLGDSLVGQYLFDESSAGDNVAPSGVGSLVDSSGGGHNATPYGSTVVWSANTPFGTGYSMRFSSGYIKSNAVNFITAPNQSHAMFAWIYPTNTSAYSGIVSYGEMIDSRSLSCLGIGNGQLMWFSNGSYGAEHYDGQKVASGVTIPLNKWSFVGFSQTVSTITFYINGVPTAAMPNGGSYVNIVAGNPFEIGATANNGGVEGYFTGNIDNVRIYDRALDTSEIQKLYAMDAPRHGVAFVGSAPWGMFAH